MPSPRTRGRRPAAFWKRPERGRWRRLRFVLISLGLLGVVGLLLLGVVSLRVAAGFEARERESPTRMYGRSLALLEGAHLTGDDLVERLVRLGYRRTRNEPEAPGEFLIGRRQLVVYLRSFESPAGTVEATLVRLRHRGDRITSVRDLQTGRRTDQAALEPEVLATLYGDHAEERTVLPLAAFPQQLVDAVLIAEDRHFYSHPGIDPTAIARATWTNIKSGSIKQGGSTLTQQLAKNLFFERERTWSRKISEAVVALILEARYSKDRILQAYLNEIYLGQKGAVSIHGFGQAADFYFGKDVAKLELGEVAMLAGLIRAPGLYNPFRHPDRAREQRDQILAAMEEMDRITPGERAATEATPLTLSRSGSRRSRTRGVSYLADYARQMIGDDTLGDLSRAGVRIYTTVDASYQQEAETALRRGLERLERSYARLRRTKDTRKLQGAMVVLDQHSGSILAMVGGRDYATSQFNRITQAHRQPGSLFKPFVYLAGWGSGVLNPASLLQDEPLEMEVAGKTWSPANYDRTYRGPVTAQMALEQSLNVPTVRASQVIGLDEIVDVARRAGIETSLKQYPSVVLGAQEVTPLEIASAYATIANGGSRFAPALVEAIEDGDGTTIFRRKSGGATPALPSVAAYQITVALQGAIDRGTGKSSRRLGFTGTAAGKTGTTDNYRDAWFVGYTPDLLALVWVGFDDGASTGLAGAAAALPIWVDFMERAGGETDDVFAEPDGIVWEEVDPTSGGLARWACPRSSRMAFAEGTEPIERCEHHGLFRRWRNRRAERFAAP